MRRTKPRAAAILIQDNHVALLERHRQGLHYFAFPGGGVSKGETPQAAAVREVEEELGLLIEVERLVAEVWYEGVPQYFYLARILGGEFGSGHGREMSSLPDSEQGSYHPTWLPLAELLDQPVLPQPVARLVHSAVTQGWSDQPLVLREAVPD